MTAAELAAELSRATGKKVGLLFWNNGDGVDAWLGEGPRDPERYTASAMRGQHSVDSAEAAAVEVLLLVYGGWSEQQGRLKEREG